MGEWRDNTEEKLGHTSKWESVSQAANELENISSELGCADVGELPGWLSERVITWIVARPYGRKPEPRWMAAANAVASLQAAIEALADVEKLQPDREWYAKQLAATNGLLEMIGEQKGARHTVKQRERVRSQLVENKSCSVDVDAITALRDTLQEQAEALESVEFPSMYG